MRVLVIFPGAIGDLICLAPCLWHLRRKFPHAALELMARGELVRLATGRLGINRGESIDRSEVAALFVEFVRAPDASVTLFGGYQKIYSFFAAGNPVFRRMLQRACAGDVTFHNFRPESSGHIAAAYLESIGAGTDKIDYRIELLNSDLEAAKAALRAVKLIENDCAVIFPGSGGPAKNWPLVNYLELVPRLPLKAVFVIGPAEEDYAPLINRAGLAAISNLELPTVAAIAKLARFFIGNDSGVSHLAAAAGARGVVLFGPTDPDRWRPLGAVRVISRMPFSSLSVDLVSATVADLARG
ncbi:MAG: glycosyltransferase family 9 protein [Candidatus Binataceae bacterium]|nr:glycosyltransferase family 9 protein [Candidatus Binataceae bacterium]